MIDQVVHVLIDKRDQVVGIQRPVAGVGRGSVVGAVGGHLLEFVLHFNAFAGAEEIFAGAL